MKKTIFLLVAAGLLFAACTKTNSAGNTPRQALVGKWRVTYAKSFLLSNGEAVLASNRYGILDTCAKDGLVEFRSDNSYRNDQELIFTQDSTHTVGRSRILELASSHMRLYAGSKTTGNGQPVSAQLILLYKNNKFLHCQGSPLTASSHEKAFDSDRRRLFAFCRL